MTGERYFVTSISGYLEHGNSQPGTTYSVLDRLRCHRVMGSFRTEETMRDLFSLRFLKLADRDRVAKRNAQELCDRLNERERELAE